MTILFFCFAFTSLAQAHKVVVFAWVEDGFIRTESGFGSRRPAKNCEIRVYTRGKDSENLLVHTGRTNENGEYAFKVSDLKKSGWLGNQIEVHLSAGPGHAGQWTIPASELVKDYGPGSSSIEDKMARKEDLKKDPSPLKIGIGIILIFILAFIIGRIKKIQKKPKGANAG